MGLFTQLLSFNGLARRLPTICKKSSQRTSNSDSRQKKDVLKNIRFSNYFMLGVFISLIKFSKIVFEGGHWDFRFCGFGYFFDRFFGFWAQRPLFFGFGVHRGLRIFHILASGFRFS